MKPFFKKIFPALTIFTFTAGAVIALPSYKEIRSSYNKSDTVLLDRRGIPLYELRTDRHIRRQDWAMLRDISPALIMAVVYAEDKRFFEHSGADYRSIGAAIIRGIGPAVSGGEYHHYAAGIFPGTRAKAFGREKNHYARNGSRLSTAWI